MEVIIILAAFALGAYIGYKSATALFVISFKNIMDDLGITEQQLRKVAEQKGIDLGQETAVQEDQTTAIEIRLEQERNQIYAYRKDTNQFLAQGPDADALISHLNLTFANGARLIVRETDGAELLHKNNG